MLIIFSFIVLSVVLGAQIFWRPFLAGGKIIKLIFIFSVIVIFSYLAYLSWLQYVAWENDEISKHFLGQKIDDLFFNTGFKINYFIFYVGTRFFAPYFISLAAALLFLFSVKILNKKYQERFFESEEIWIGSLAIFLIGYPGWLIYFIFIIFVYLSIHIYSLFAVHYLSQRISLYYLWIPLAIFVILVNKWLVSLELWRLLKI